MNHPHRVRAASRGSRAVLVAALVGLAAPAALAQVSPPPSEPLTPSTARPGDPFRIGPVAGLTTAWHAAPRATAIPLGARLELEMCAEPSAVIVWTGADEVTRTGQASLAVRDLALPGPTQIRVAVLRVGRRPELRRIDLDVVPIDPSHVAVTDLKLDVTPHGLHEDASNAETMERYFGFGSVAALRRLGGDRYRTSVSRELSLSADVSPTAFAPLVEWRVDGQALALGPRTTSTFHDPGTRRIAAGPPGASRTADVETYAVTIVSPAAPLHVRDGEPVTFVARTEPAGYESEVTWISSTKHGTAHPVVGAGESFTVLFQGTTEHQPDGDLEQWLGVRADQAYLGQDQKANVSFAQTDENIDGNVVTDSDWGSMDLTAPATTGVRYVSLSVNGTWQVQNIPLVPTALPGAPQRTTFNFSLGNTPGVDVTGLTYGLEIGPAPLPAMPQSVNSAPVGDRTVNIFSGMQGETSTVNSARPMIGGGAQQETVGVNIGFPNQECGPAECAPAAVSNSLMFLNDKHNLGLAANQIDIPAMKNATGFIPGFGVSPANWVAAKDQYMQANNIPITTTTTTDPAVAIQALRNDCDVELQGTGHLAGVTGIVILDNGKVGITVKHDTDQDGSGGLKEEIVIWNPMDDSLWDGKWFDGTSFTQFVIECPE